MDQRKIAVVTGAGSGIGRNAALALAKRDFAVVLAGRNEQTLKETAALAGSAQTLAIPTDVSKVDSVAQLFEKTKAAFGRVDVLFNNAGTSAPPVPFEDLTAQQWDVVVAVNLTGAFLVAQAAYRVMKEQT